MGAGTKRVSQETVDAGLRAHSKDRPTYITGLDLRGMDLRAAESLEGIKIIECDLRGADLSRVCLHGAQLTNCNPVPMGKATPAKSPM